uniref:Uncharacterized protein n=1 Tax=Tetraodon nigroviridis TaxID=99883 RepID=H3BW63_TETNG
ITMESNVSLMIMYDDESVEVCYRNEDRLLLSPCGCEFVLVKACREPPLAEARVRQRTRFTTSTHKEMITGALTFRNTHASRPYLPAELIPADHKKPFFSIGSEAKWPELSSCAGELRCGGETIIRSEEGRAVLTLAPSGEEFSVRYTCSLSSHDQNHSTQPGAGGPGSSPGAAAGDDTDEEQLGRRKRKDSSVITKNRKVCIRHQETQKGKPEAAYQCTTVLQQLSRCCVAPRWRYPLSLARRLHTARLSEPEDAGAEESRRLSQAADGGRRSPLPQALPLTCPSPHLHRWRFDPLFKNEHQQLPGDLVKVMWCHGTTYRVLSGGVPVVEVSLGDGSIIRSDGVLSSYFTHHKP